MNITFINNVTKQEWEENLFHFKEANFLQSWNWGVFQESLGREVFRIVIKDSIRTIAMVQAVFEKAKRGNYLSIAGGPLLDWNNLELITAVFQELSKIAKTKNAVFLRFRPQELNSDHMKLVAKKIGAITSNMHLTADLTLQVDLEPSEEEILKQMRKNTRYSIRRVEKESITTIISKDEKEIKTFYDHQLELAKKHGFVSFSYKFLFNQFSAFIEDDQVALIHSYKDEKLLASAFVIFYNNEAVYHYGISTDDNARLPGSYACQWRAIQEAKSRGCKRYNLWGISPDGNKNHRFSGVSIFKRGFGGQEIEYFPSHDIPMSNLYYLTYLFEFLRKKIRKL